MDEKEITEVPLSNREVLKVLNARNKNEHHPRTLQMIEYLETIEKGKYKYPLEVLRDIKNIKADLNTLTMVSNMSDLNLLDISDKKIVESYLKKNKINS